MIKSFDIGGREVALRANVHTWFVYKAQFGREMGEDLKRALHLDEARNAAPDEIEEARLYGEECRLFMQLLWAFAYEGTDGLPPFERWVKNIGGVSMPQVVATVADLFIATMKPDKRYRIGQADSGDGGTLTTEELAEMIYSSGADSLALKDLTVGMALNLAHAHANAIKRARGETVSDPAKQYRIMRGILDDYERGALTDEDIDPAELEKIRQAVAEWESDE